VFCCCSIRYRGRFARKDAVKEPTAKVARAVCCFWMKQIQLSLINLNRRNNRNWFLLDVKRSGRHLNVRMSMLVWNIRLVLYRVRTLAFHVRGRAQAETLYSWFQTFAVFWMLYVFFWVIPRRLNFICRRFGTLCLFHLHRQVGIYTYLPMKIEQAPEIYMPTFRNTLSVPSS